MAAILSGLSGVPPFEFHSTDISGLAQQWKQWKARFEIYLTASGVTNKPQQRALLLHMGGQSVQKLFETLPDTGTDYASAIKALDKYFELKKNIPKERQQFLAMAPEPGESIKNFIVRLKKKITDCEYGDEEENQIRDRVMYFIKDKTLKRKLFRQEELTLSKLEELVNLYDEPDALLLGSDTVKREEQAHAIQSAPRYGSKKFQGNCWRCNTPGHVGKECIKSKEHICEKCGKKGHFAVCCHTKDSAGKQSGKHAKPKTQFKKKKQTVHAVEQNEQSSSQPMFYAFTVGQNKQSTLPVKVEGKQLHMLVDSGSTCNIISEKSMSDAVRRKLKKCDVSVYAYAAKSPLDVLGRCTVDMSVPGSPSISAPLLVVSGDHVALLGRETAEQLGVLHVGLPAVCKVGGLTKAQLREMHPKAFEGLGKLKDYQLLLEIDDQVTPKAQAYRRMPLSRRGKVVKVLSELGDLDVLERVTKPSGWVSSLVTAEKRNGEIRVCVDMREANKAIKRERQPIPTFDETLHDMSEEGEMKVISRLDMLKAFHQIELHPSCRDITTFAGPDGLYRYKRLMFGINMATEKFNHIIRQILQDCPGAFNIHDDIIVGGRNEEEHDERVLKVVRKFEECGLTFNYEKTEFKVNKVNFMGHTLSSEGLQLSEDKAKAISEAPEPKNAGEVKSFLCSAQFSARFIPDFSTITHPLWELTHDKAKWKWTEVEQAAFQEVKSRMTTAPVMAYYKLEADTYVITDASPVGLGAMLMQEQEDKEYKPVHYASRKLSPTETRYSQFEREALAVKWACEKFHMYLSGRKFKIHTDHKPLIPIYGGMVKPPNARIERWLLAVQSYDFTIHYIPGRKNIADGLSRLPIEGSTEEDPEGVSAEDYVYSVVMDAVPAALTAASIEHESAKDPMLAQVRRAVQEDRWAELEHTIYKSSRDELWSAGQIVMKGSRIVVPQKLQKQVISLAHEGHQGMVRTKARIREKVWWPRMDRDVETFVKNCYPCQLVGPRGRPEPIKSTALPQGPWSEVAVDLCGPLPNGDNLLVLIDYFSRWPEVVWMRNTNSPAVIKVMETVFTTHGLPDRVRSDNGPQFIAQEFEEFLEYLGIEHVKGVPYWPQSNGEVERFNETMLKAIKIAEIEKKDWKKELQNFLFQYRTTPHTVTGVSPAEMLMGRKLRDKLPKLELMSNEPMTELRWQAQIRERDQRRKRYEKELADKRRGAQPSEIEPGDEVLLNQPKRNKLTPRFEEKPYKVISKDGNAVLIQRGDESVKMRNVAHMKRLHVGQQDILPALADNSPISPPQLAVATPVPPPPDPPPPGGADTEQVPSHDTGPRRSSRARSEPTWLQDYVK